MDDEQLKLLNELCARIRADALPRMYCINDELVILKGAHVENVNSDDATNIKGKVVLEFEPIELPPDIGAYLEQKEEGKDP